MKTLLILWAMSGGTGQPIIHEYDAYGPGMHMDQYGGVIKTQPGLRFEQDAYGPDVHMDQYGRAIKFNKPQTINIWE